MALSPELKTVAQINSLRLQFRHGILSDVAAYHGNARRATVHMYSALGFTSKYIVPFRSFALVFGWSLVLVGLPLGVGWVVEAGVLVCVSVWSRVWRLRLGVVSCRGGCGLYIGTYIY